MAEIIGFDYAFEEFSLPYGQFITDAREGYPEGKIERVTHHHPYKKDQIVLHFAAPEEITVLLKLKFGAHIVVRPPKPSPEDLAKEEMMSKMKQIIKQKKSYDFESYWINEQKSIKNEYYNRLDILKNRTSIPTRSVADIEREIARLEAERTAELNRQERAKQKIWYDYEASFDEDLISKFKRYYKKIDNE